MDQPKAFLSDVVDLPAYTLGRAAHYVGVPYATLSGWVKGRGYPAGGVTVTSLPLISRADAKSGLLSFTNLVEAHVLSAIRKIHKVKMSQVRPALDYVERKLNIPKPLVNAAFKTDGVALFVERLGQTVDASKHGQPVLGEILREHLSRVEWDGSLVARLFPFSRALDARVERLVMLSPIIAFGRLTVAGTGVPTSVVASRFLAGERIPALVEDYGIAADKVEEALRWEIPEFRALAA